jgi:hypothetical protein
MSPEARSILYPLALGLVLIVLLALTAPGHVSAP